MCQKRYARWGRPPVSRDPNTTSAAPRTIGSISAGTSYGSYSMSASWITLISASACGIAALTAAPLPRCDWRTSTTPSRPSAKRSTTAAVSSVEPSSTTTICGSSSSSTMRSRTSPIVSASLYAGTRNETRIGLTLSRDERPEPLGKLVRTELPPLSRGLRGPCEPLDEPRVSRDPEHCVSQCDRGFGLEQDSIDVVLDDVGDAARPGADHGPPTQQRLDRDPREPLGARRQHECGRLVESASHLGGHQARIPASLPGKLRRE